MSQTQKTQEGLTPGDRRELRSLIKRRFAVLRQEVKRREQEMVAEVDKLIAQKYRGQSEALRALNLEVERARSDFMLALEKIAADQRAMLPDWNVRVSPVGYHGVVYADPPADRGRERAALMSAIPVQVADALSRLDHQELELLQDLTVGAMSGEQGRAFLGRIPTVGELVSMSALRELERSLATIETTGDVDA